MTESQRKLTVWVVSDGVAGHYRQSEGVVLALQQLADVEAGVAGSTGARRIVGRGDGNHLGCA